MALSNSAGSFKPYSVSEVIGDTTPAQPLPPVPAPRKRGCGVFGQILMIVVLIVVTVYSAGLASGFTGSFASTMSAGAGALAGGATVGAGAAAGLGAFGSSVVGALAGGIASQAVGLATGTIDRFDWKGVALGAISAGIGAAVGGTSTALGRLVRSVPGQGALQAAVTGAVGNALTQGVAVAAGLQNKFSWRDVAISAVAAPIAGKAKAVAGSSPFAGDVVSGIAGSLVRGAFGGKIDNATVLADAFGHALGNSLVAKLSGPGSAAIPSAAPGSAAEEALSEITLTAQYRDPVLAPLTSNPSSSVLNPAAARTADDQRLEAVQITAQRRSIYGSSVSVASGETLTGIAAKELGKGASQADILARAQQYMQANGISDPSKLQAGAKLIVPALDVAVSKVTLQNYAAHDAKVHQARAAEVATAESSSTTTAQTIMALPIATANIGTLAMGRSSMSSFWAEAQDDAARDGNFLKYLGAGLMGKLGSIGYGAGELGVAAYDSPGGTLRGAGNAIVNFGPELFNGAVNLGKFSAVGWTVIGESTFLSAGALDGFRQSTPYNIDLLMPYANQSEVAGSLLANLGMGVGLAKYGTLPLRSPLVPVAAGVSGAANSAALRSQAAANVWEARGILRDAGLNPLQRNEILRSFELETFRVERTLSEGTAFRLFDDTTARLQGRYVSTEVIANHTDRIQNFALMNNSATRRGQVTIPRGSVVFTGRVAPQPFFSSGLTGGANQTFLTGPLNNYTFREIMMPR